MWELNFNYLRLGESDKLKKRWKYSAGAGLIERGPGTISI